jgi:hypothetical protein
VALGFEPGLMFARQVLLLPAQGFFLDSVLGGQAIKFNATRTGSSYPPVLTTNSYSKNLVFKVQKYSTE